MKRLTKVVKPVKPVIQESDKEETNEAAMRRISLNMAVYWNKNITPKELIMWHLKATDLLIDYMAHKNYDKEKCTSTFLASFGWRLIPSLLDAKTSNERKRALLENMMEIYTNGVYEDFKANLEEIGNAYLSEYARVIGGEDGIHEFTRILSCLMVITDMCGDYELHYNQDFKARQANEKLAQSDPANLNLKSFISDHAN